MSKCVSRVPIFLLKMQFASSIVFFSFETPQQKTKKKCNGRYRISFFSHVYGDKLCVCNIICWIDLESFEKKCKINNKIIFALLFVPKLDSIEHLISWPWIHSIVRFDALSNILALQFQTKFVYKYNIWHLTIDKQKKTKLSKAGRKCHFSFVYIL